MILATIECYLTHLARWSAFVCASKSHKSLESCNDEKSFKEVNGREVLLRPGVLEKDNTKNSIRSYQEPGTVPLAEKAKTSRENPVKGIRQISPVSLV